MTVDWDAVGAVTSVVSKTDVDAALWFREETGNKNTTKQISE